MTEDDDSAERNPLIVPRGKPIQRMTGCPKCKENDYVGRNIQGVITYKCNKCQNSWQGGLPQQPQDPSIPQAPVDPRDKPTVDFARNKFGEVVEQRRGVNPTQEYRKGLPVTQGDE